MKLNQEELEANRLSFLAAGFKLPCYDRECVKKKTLEHPAWVHFGPGNLFKAFPAHAVQVLLNNDRINTGLIAVEGHDYEIVKNLSLPFNHLHVLVTLHADGRMEKEVIGSILETLILDQKHEEDMHRLRAVFANPSLQIASFTITEKGYSVRAESGALYDAIVQDIAAGPLAANSYLGKVCALLYHRFQTCRMPLAMVSMDNCSHNGDRLKEAMLTLAMGWAREGHVDNDFADYLSDASQIAFPWTMIDKITPRPDPQVGKMLADSGLEEVTPIVTSRNSYVAPYVNAEPVEYLVIEDIFPNGRPPLEHAGILLTDRKTVEKAEKMKVCTCLNPLHTALAIFGCLLGYEKISDEMQDENLRRLAEKLGYEEGLPVVNSPGILSPEEFLDTVLTKRLPNPYLPDSPKRIATDTSQKLSVRFGETIKAYQKKDPERLASLKIIPLVIAGWFRYLCGVDDRGEAFPISPDPGAARVQECLRHFSLGDDLRSNPDLTAHLQRLLSDRNLFGVDYVACGLSDRIIHYFSELSRGPGAVEKTLSEVLRFM